MPMKTPEFVRWDAEHHKSIEVFYQEDELDEIIRLDAEYFGIDVFSSVEDVAKMFSATGRVWTQHQIDKIEVESRRKGDRVFYLEYGEHSGYGFRLYRHECRHHIFGRCAGILVARRCTWPETSFIESYVFKRLDEAFSERGCAVLNGWVFEAVVKTEEGNCCYRDHLSEEEALADAQRDYPDIKYSNDQFVTSYRLAA